MFFEQMHFSRRKGALIETVLAIVIGILCSLSCGAVDLEIAGMSVLSFCDFLTSNILLPLGSFFTCILVGWVAPQKLVRDEVTNWGTTSRALYKVWLLLVRYVSPVSIALVFLHQLNII